MGAGQFKGVAPVWRMVHQIPDRLQIIGDGPGKGPVILHQQYGIVQRLHTSPCIRP